MANSIIDVHGKGLEGQPSDLLSGGEKQKGYLDFARNYFGKACSYTGDLVKEAEERVRGFFRRKDLGGVVEGECIQALPGIVEIDDARGKGRSYLQIAKVILPSLILTSTILTSFAKSRNFLKQIAFWNRPSICVYPTFTPRGNGQFDVLRTEEMVRYRNTHKVDVHHKGKIATLCVEFGEPVRSAEFYLDGKRFLTFDRDNTNPYAKGAEGQSLINWAFYSGKHTLGEMMQACSRGKYLTGLNQPPFVFGAVPSTDDTNEAGLLESVNLFVRNSSLGVGAHVFEVSYTPVDGKGKKKIGPRHVYIRDEIPMPTTEREINRQFLDGNRGHVRRVVDHTCNLEDLPAMQKRVLCERTSKKGCIPKNTLPR